MAETKLSIMNKSLIVNGARTIVEGDDSKNSRIVETWWEGSLKSCLCECLWSFATKSVMLTPNTELAPAWVKNGASSVYTKPSDCVQLFQKNIPNAVIYEENIEGQLVFLSTAQNNLGIRYTFYNDVPATYMPDFVQALAYKLALDTSFDIVGSTSKVEDITMMYNTIYLPKALTSNSAINEPDDLECNLWTDAKYYGGNGSMYDGSLY